MPSAAAPSATVAVVFSAQPGWEGPAGAKAKGWARCRPAQGRWRTQALPPQQRGRAQPSSSKGARRRGMVAQHVESSPAPGPRPLVALMCAGTSCGSWGRRALPSCSGMAATRCTSSGPLRQLTAANLDWPRGWQLPMKPSFRSQSGLDAGAWLAAVPTDPATFPPAHMHFAFCAVAGACFCP